MSAAQSTESDGPISADGLQAEITSLVSNLVDNLTTGHLVSAAYALFGLQKYQFGKTGTCFLASRMPLSFGSLHSLFFPMV